MNRLTYFSFLFLLLFLFPSGVAATTATPGGAFLDTPGSQSATKSVLNAPVSPNASASDPAEMTEYSVTETVPQTKPKQNTTAIILSIGAMLIGVAAIVLVIRQKSSIEKGLLTTEQRIDALSTRMDKVSAEITSIKQDNEDLRKQIKQLTTVVNKNSSASQASVPKNVSSPRNASNNETRNTKPQETKSKTFRTCYALAQEQGGRILLYEGDDNCRALFPFSIYHDGSKGEISFNPESFAAVVTQMEVKLTPYAECKINNTNAPSRINTIKKGSVTKEGDYWVVMSKPVLEII